MSAQVSSLGEPHRAVLAFKWPILLVRPSVQLQRPLLVERLLADGALKRPLPRVDPLVTLELARLLEALVAEVTLVWVVVAVPPLLHLLVGSVPTKQHHPRTLTRSHPYFFGYINTPALYRTSINILHVGQLTFIIDIW